MFQEEFDQDLLQETGLIVDETQYAGTVHENCSTRNAYEVRNALVQYSQDTDI